MGVDKRGVSHGKCTQCNECEEYETSGSNALCEYCGHRPVQQIDPEGNIKIICQICDVAITPGQKKQRLFNVKQHFMESSSHKSKVVSLAGRENVPSESIVILDMDEGKKK